MAAARPKPRRRRRVLRFLLIALFFMGLGAAATVVAFNLTTSDASQRQGDAGARPPADTPPPSRPPEVAGRPAFQSDFETGNFDEWTTVNEPAGTVFVGTADGEGIPTRAGGRFIAHFEVTEDQQEDGEIHSKVYKEWGTKEPILSRRNKRGEQYERLPGDSAAGTYRAWYFVPTGYRADNKWVNIMQWKEHYGEDDQDPQWWLQIGPAGAFGDTTPGNGPAPADDAPVLFVNHWENEDPDTAPRLWNTPTGRWFEVRAELYPGDRIDWYIDGRLFDSSRHETYPVGLRERSTGWIFGVGHYGGIGRLYVDDVSFTPRG